MILSIDVRPHIKEVLKSFLELNLLNEKVWLAGGALRDALNGNHDVSDYDVFFSNLSDANAISFLLEIDFGFECIFKCPAGELTTFKKDGMKIQLITKRTYDSMDDAIDTFDITSCRHITDGKIIVTKYSSIRDTFNKKINFHKIEYPYATFKRTQKYIQKGFVLTNKAINFYIDRIYSAGSTNDSLDKTFYID